MPELPDVTAYLEALEQRLMGQRLRRVRLPGSFVLGTVEPAPEALAGLQVTGFRPIGAGSPAAPFP